MKTFQKYWLVVLMLIGFQIRFVDAQNTEDAIRYSQLGLGVSAQQLGMGNAAVGGVNDYSALFWNPAGLALERNFEFSFGFSWLNYSNDATYLNSTTTSNTSAMNLNNIGIVYPIQTSRGSLTFAFGFNRAANYTSTANLNAVNSSNSFTQLLIPTASYLNGLDSAGRVNFFNNTIPGQLDLVYQTVQAFCIQSYLVRFSR